MLFARRLRRIGAFASLAASVILTADAARADRVVLRNGTSVTGLVANREQVAARPEDPREIGLLITLEDGTEALRRLPVADISYVVLEDGEAQRVLEFSPPPERAPAEPPAPEHTSGPMAMSARKPGGHSPNAGWVLMTAAGVGMVLLGVATARDDDNFGLGGVIAAPIVIVGGAFVVVGLVGATNSRSAASHADLARDPDAAAAPRVDVALSYGF